MKASIFKQTKTEKIVGVLRKLNAKIDINGLPYGEFLSRFRTDLLIMNNAHFR